MFETGWLYNQAPYMILVPTHRPFYGPLFHRLHYMGSAIPIRRSSGRFQLDADVVREWRALEHNLITILHVMMTFDLALPRDFRVWRYPYYYGYEALYANRKDAVIVAARSRDSFIPLMATLTMFIILLEQERRRRPDFNWRDVLLEKTEIHHQWFSELENSAVGDLTIPRVGGIVTMETCQYKWMLSELSRRANTPLYLYWGTSPPLYRPSDIDNEFVPTPATLSNLKRIPRYVTSTSTISSTPVPPSFDVSHSSRDSAPLPPSSDSVPPRTSYDSVPPRPSHNSVPTFPPVEQYSGQKPGEDWREFFKRREEHNKWLEENETPEARDKRKQREKHAAIGACPGKKGARVYVWEDCDGFLIRRAAGRAHYEGYWDDFGHNQRRYDSFRDEWDLCAALAPDDTAQFEEDSDYNDDDDDYFNPPSQSDTIAQHSASDLAPPMLDDNPSFHPDTGGANSATVDLQRIYDTLDVDPQPYESHDYIHDLAFYRFGFTTPMGEVPDPAKKPTWGLVTKILGQGWDPPAQQPHSYLPAFIGYLMSARSLTQVPEELCDLRQNELSQQWHIQVRSVTLTDKVYYFITPASMETDSTRLMLATTSAVAVIEIVRRQWGPGLIEIMRQLLDRSISFNTFILGSWNSLVPRSIIPHYNGLGYRPPNYSPDQIDYRAYEHLRLRLLNSAKGRAAMLMGGIVARLARDVVSYDTVCLGPSDNAEYDGLQISHRSQSLAFFDDQLTADDVNVICGVYKVDTGELFCQ
jgi:hypothetical protein